MLPWVIWWITVSYTHLFCYTAVFTTVLHFIIHYKTFHYLPGSMTESIKVAGGFLLGLPHTCLLYTSRCV